MLFPADALLISVPQYSHGLHIAGVETPDQREHRDPTKEQTELVQAKGNHEESSCETQHLAPAVKVCDNRVALLLIPSADEFIFTAPSLTVSRSNDPKERISLPTTKLNRFANHTTSYTIKNTNGELFTYTPSGKVRIPASANSKIPSLTFTRVLYWGELDSSIYLQQ